jgi:hypothetical protein
MALIGIFANLEDADRATRRLLALGLTEDAVEIVDLARLVVEFNPEFADLTAVGTTAATASEANGELVTALGRQIAAAIDLPQYLVDTGVPQQAASYYARQIRAGAVLLVAAPAAAQIAEIRESNSLSDLVEVGAVPGRVEDQ